MFTRVPATGASTIRWPIPKAKLGRLSQPAEAGPGMIDAPDRYRPVSTCRSGPTYSVSTSVEGVEKSMIEEMSLGREIVQLPHEKI